MGDAGDAIFNKLIAMKKSLYKRICKIASPRVTRPANCWRSRLCGHFEPVTHPSPRWRKV